MAKNTRVPGMGRGRQGACGGQRRFDGSGNGIGNFGTTRQPKKKE